MAESKDEDGCASHDSLAAPATPGNTTSNAGVVDHDSSALDKPKASISSSASAASVTTTTQDSLAASATLDNAASNPGAADFDSSSDSSLALDTSNTSTAPTTPTTRASTILDSSPLDRFNVTEAAKASNTSPPPEKPDSAESEHKAGFAKFASQIQASGSGSQARSKFGASFSPFSAHVAGQSLSGFGSRLESVSKTSASFPLCAAGERISFGSGREGGIIGGSSAGQSANFGKPDDNIIEGGTKRGFGDVSRDDDNSDEPSNKRARTDGGSNPAATSGHAAHNTVQNSTSTSTGTRNTSQDVPNPYPPIAPAKLNLAGFGSATMAHTPAAASSAPHSLFGTNTYNNNAFSTMITPSRRGQDAMNNVNKANCPDGTNIDTSSDGQDGQESEDRSKNKGTIDTKDSRNPDSIDNGEEEEIL